MQELFKSFTSLSIALTLFGLKQGQNIFYSGDHPARGNRATESMEALTAATIREFGGTMRATFDALDNVQRGMFALAASVIWPAGSEVRGRRDGNTVTETFDDSAVRRATDWPYDSRTKVAPDQYPDPRSVKVH